MSPRYSQHVFRTSNLLPGNMLPWCKRGVEQVIQLNLVLSFVCSIKTFISHLHLIYCFTLCLGYKPTLRFVKVYLNKQAQVQYFPIPLTLSVICLPFVAYAGLTHLANEWANWRFSVSRNFDGLDLLKIFDNVIGVRF